MTSLLHSASGSRTGAAATWTPPRRRDTYKQRERDDPSASAFEPLAPSVGDGDDCPAQPPPTFHSDTRPSQPGGKVPPRQDDGWWESASFERALCHVSAHRGQDQVVFFPQKGRQGTLGGDSQGWRILGAEVRCRCGRRPQSASTSSCGPLCHSHAPASTASPRPAGPSTQEDREKEKGPHRVRKAAGPRVSATAPLPAAQPGQGPSCPGDPGSGSWGCRWPWKQGKGPPAASRREVGWEARGHSRWAAEEHWRRARRVPVASRDRAGNLLCEGALSGRVRSSCGPLLQVER